VIAGRRYPVSNQHLFWFYSDIMIVAGMGMVSDIISVFSPQTDLGYRPMVYAMAGIGLPRFIVWAHQCSRAA